MNIDKISIQAQKFYTWMMSDRFPMDEKRSLKKIKAKEEFDEALAYIYKTCDDRLKGFSIKRIGDIIWKEKCVKMDYNAGEIVFKYTSPKINYNYREISVILKEYGKLIRLTKEERDKLICKYYKSS